MPSWPRHSRRWRCGRLETLSPRAGLLPCGAMLCYCWNVNGIRAVARKKLLPWEVLPKADVICLQETKAQQEMLEHALGEPEGWHSHWHSAKKPGYSGVAIFTREQPDEVLVGLGEDQFDDE